MKNQNVQAVISSVIDNRKKLGQRNDNVRSTQLAKNDILTFDSTSVSEANYEQYKYAVFTSGAFTLTEKHFVACGNGIPLKETGYNERLLEFANMVDGGITLKVVDVRKQINRFREGYDLFYVFEVVATNTTATDTATNKATK